MAAYVIIKIKTDNLALLKDYQSVAPAIIEQYKGKFLARGGEVVTLEGPAELSRMVIIEFSSLADAKAFYDSPEYTKAIELRKDIATAEIVAINGL